MILSLVPLVLAACSPPATPPTPPPTLQAAPSATAPDLVVVLVSGWRPDHEGRPGGEAALLEGLGRTPDFTATRTYAQSTSQLLSTASLLTGRYVSSLPMCGLTVTDLDSPATRAWCTAIPADRPTLAEVLGLYGYRTALLTADFPGDDLVARGFGQATVAEVPERPFSRTDWPRLQDAALAWWNAPDPAPRLLVVVVSDLIPFRHRHLVPDPSERDVEPGEAGARRYQETLWRTWADEARQVGTHLDPLLDAVEGTGRPAWVFVTSTHGAHLGEPSDVSTDQPAFSSYEVLRDFTLRVPLHGFAIHAPAPPTRQVDQVVELLDLFPTLAGLAGAVAPAGLTGQDLLSPSFTPDPDAWAYAELGDMFATRQGSWFYCFRAMYHMGAALDPELTHRLETARDLPGAASLHEVETDPFQLHDRWTTEPERRASLWQRTLDTRRGPALPPATVLTPERLWELRMSEAKGYW